MAHVIHVIEVLYGVLYAGIVIPFLFFMYFRSGNGNRHE